MVPGVLGGKPVIRGTRISVEHVLDSLAAGETIDELLVDYPFLSREDLLAAIEFGSTAVRNQYPVASGS